MSNLTTGAEAIKRMAVQFQAIIDVADMLSATGSLEDMSAEATKAKIAAVEDRDKALTALAKAKDGIGAAEAEAGNILASAKNDADTIKATATISADRILSDAETKAKAIIAGVHAQCEGLQTEVAAKITKQQIILDSLAIAVIEAESRAATADKTATDAEARLANVQAAIAKLASA